MIQGEQHVWDDVYRLRCVSTSLTGWLVVSYLCSMPLFMLVSNVARSLNARGSKMQGILCKPVIQNVLVYFLYQSHLFHPQGSQCRNSPQVVSSFSCRPLYLTILSDWCSCCYAWMDGYRSCVASLTLWALLQLGQSAPKCCLKVEDGFLTGSCCCSLSLEAAYRYLVGKDEGTRR